MVLLEQNQIDGNIVILAYVVTNGIDANGATAFTSSTNISGFGDITIVTNTAACWWGCT